MHEELINSLDLTSVAKEFVSTYDVHKKYFGITNKLIFYFSFQQNTTFQGCLGKYILSLCTACASQPL